MELNAEPVVSNVMHSFWKNNTGVARPLVAELFMVSALWNVCLSLLVFTAKLATTCFQQ